jgi:hypothetical protein
VTTRLLLVGLLAACLAAVVRPAVVRTEDGARLLVLWRGQSGRIAFVNSVTGRPVAIRFRIGNLFHGFEMRTDAVTEDYYTNGLYLVNDVVSGESTNALRFCSMKGIHLTLGSHELESSDGCLEVELLWTACSGESCTPSRS